MKISVKLIIQYLAFGISWGCTFFVLVSMIIFLTGGETAMSYLVILQLVISIAGFIMIWFCFYLFYRNEAKQINARLRELEKSLPEE